MAAKILISADHNLSREGVLEARQRVADALGVCLEDVVLCAGLSVQVVEVPDSLVKEREKADAEAAKEKEKAEKERLKAEKDQADRDAAAAAEKAKAEAKATPTPTVGTAATASPTPASPAPTDYDSWSLEDLHKEATTRDLHGRSGLDKAGLVKALRKSDKGK